MLKNKKIVVIGAGTMGKIIISGLLEAEKTSPDMIIATARMKETIKQVSEEFGIKTMNDNAAACEGADIIILAVKPQDISNVINSVKALAAAPLVISIAAGIGTAFIENILKNKAPLVRAMPNTPCLIGKGMTVICRGTYALDEHMEISKYIFEVLGKCIELEEKHMDAVTGLSASGPAFVYLIMEALIDGGVMVGLPRKVAQDLVIHTVIGSAYMMQQTERHPAALKDDVTTPAGCTISGILALEDGKIRSVLARAVQIASCRAKELGK